MDELPAIDLLERTHTFPGVYIFKVIGRSERAFAERVIAATREALGWDVDPPFRVRGGRRTTRRRHPGAAPGDRP